MSGSLGLDEPDRGMRSGEMTLLMVAFGGRGVAGAVLQS